MTAGDISSANFFLDQDVIADPHPYFESLRGRCPVVREPHYGVMVVTGHTEAAAILKDADTFSSCVAAGGPFPPLPFDVAGDDIGDLIDDHRAELPMSAHIATMDPPHHTRVRSLLSKMFTPARISARESFIRHVADTTLDEFVDAGTCEFRSQYASPFATLVIIDLLGFPPMTPQELAASMVPQPDGENLGGLAEESVSANPLAFLNGPLAANIEDRRNNPRDDLFTEFATVTYPDGSTPELMDLVRPASFLIAAGIETINKLLTSAVRVLADRPDLQRLLRENPSTIADFVDESLRFDAPIQTIFRLARRSSTVGDVHIPAGTVVMVCTGAVNRDPSEFHHPNDFRIDRVNGRAHVSFSRGVHTCLGAALSRSEAVISISRLLERTSHVAVDERHHGPPGDRRYTYEPNFMMRGITDLHLCLTPKTEG